MTAEDVLSLAGQHLGSLTFPQAVLTLKQLAKLDQTASRDYLVSGAFLKVTSRLKDTFPRPVDEDSLPSTIDNLIWALGRLEADFSDLHFIMALTPSPRWYLPMCSGALLILCHCSAAACGRPRS